MCLVTNSKATALLKKICKLRAGAELLWFMQERLRSSTRGRSFLPSSQSVLCCSLEQC